MTGRLGAVVARMRWSLRQRGLVGTLRMVAGRLLGRRRADVTVHPFDKEYGVETSGLIGGGELSGGHAHDVFSTAYFGVPPSRFRAAVERWRSTAGVLEVSQYAFVDVGCGKGRALLLASEMGFRAVVGVELNAGLAAVAERNVQRWEELGRARCAVEVRTGDATEIELPRGPLLVYLYNPFRGEVLRRLLERLDAWAAEGGERLEVLYLYPEEEAVFGEFPPFARLWREPVGLAGEDVGVDEISAAEDPCSAYRWGVGWSDGGWAGNGQSNYRGPSLRSGRRGTSNGDCKGEVRGFFAALRMTASRGWPSVGGERAGAGRRVTERRKAQSFWLCAFWCCGEWVTRLRVWGRRGRTWRSGPFRRGRLFRGARCRSS